MAKQTIKITKKIKRKYRKSKMVKNGDGTYHCPTCGFFRGKKKK